MVNTCGFVEAAKKDSVDTLLAAADLKAAAAGTRRPSSRWAASPSGTARTWPSRCPRPTRSSASTTTPTSPRGCARSWPVSVLHPHTPQDRRKLLPISPADRDASTLSVPGHGLDRLDHRRSARRPGQRPTRRTSSARRRADGPAEAGHRLRPALLLLRHPRLPRLLRLAVGPPTCWPRPAGWPTQGVRELFLVSENSTSYGKDLGDLRLLETLLPELAAVDGIERVRVSYLQPAEIRPGLVEAIAATAGVAPYFDLSFQHASATVLRRMRRFGDPESFLGLLDRVRAVAPAAGVRSNVIVGFPGETDEDLADPVRLPGGRAGSTSSGCSATPTRTAPRRQTMDGKLDEDEIRARVEHVTDLVEQLTAQRAEERVGERGRRPGRVRRRRASPRAAPTTRGPRSTAPPVLDLPASTRSATSSPPAWSTARASTWWPPRSSRQEPARERRGRHRPATGTSPTS